MRDALESVAGDPADPRTGLAAAESCLRRALERIGDRSAAADLLAADALLTEAAARAAAAGGTKSFVADATTRLTALVPRESGR